MSTDPSCPDAGPERGTAQRAVSAMLDAVHSLRLYGPRHAVTVQAVARSLEHILRALEQDSFRLSFLPSGLRCNDRPVTSDDPSQGQIVRSVIEAGIGGLTFSPGLTRTELESLYGALALPAEEIRRRGGLRAVLDAGCCPHVDAFEQAASPREAGGRPERAGQGALKGGACDADRMIVVNGFEVSLGTMARDPEALGAALVQFARIGSMNEDDTLFAAGDILVRAATEVDRTGSGATILMSALARAAVVADGMFKGRLLKHLAREAGRREHSAVGSEGWSSLDAGGSLEALSAPRTVATGDDVAGLLRRLAPALARPGSERNLPIIVKCDATRSLAEQLLCSAEDLDQLQQVTADISAGSSDDLRASALCGTLVDLVRRNSGDESHLRLTGGLVGKLGGQLQESLAKKRFAVAAGIVSALSEAAENPSLRSRARQSLRVACDRSAVGIMVRTLEFAKEHDEDRRLLLDILSRLGGEVTPTLLEMLAGEPERGLRMTLIRVLRDLGKGQIALLGERLSDERWYFVRNIVSILGESRREEAIRYLEAAAGHGNFQVRQEVVRALVTIGGKQAADVLLRYLNDRDIDIRFMAIRGIGVIGADGAEQERALIAFIRGSWLRRPDPELRREAVIALGTVGRSAAAAFLSDLAERRVWIGRRGEQGMIAAAARDSLAKIMRRRQPHD